jgi:hypothetical protein
MVSQDGSQLITYFEFQGLVKKSVVVNRAPVMNAWATIVAERLGFSRQEALSIGKIVTPIITTRKRLIRKFRRFSSRLYESQRNFERSFSRDQTCIRTQGRDR